MEFVELHQFFTRTAAAYTCSAICDYGIDEIHLVSNSHSSDVTVIET